MEVQYIVPAAAAVVVAIIEAMAAKDRNAAKKSKESEEAQQRAHEELMLQLIKGTWAAIALGEATAKAVQRIPDAHCNGDMHDALNYAASAKHDLKEFLAKRSVHTTLE